jgi:hypothetical protein
MSAIDSRAKLGQAGKKLMLDWQHVKESWRDDNSRQFEKTYIQPLESSIRTAALAMERMGALLDKARQDCGRDRGFST